MVEVFIDGACRGNGASKYDTRGDSAIGVVIYRNKKLVGSFTRGVGKRTSNEAEYEALIHAVLWCWTLSELDDHFGLPTIYSDSLTVVNQVNGVWSCKSQDLIPLLKSVQKFSESGYHFNLKHVNRKYVREADRLANQWLDEAFEIEPKKPPLGERKDRKGSPNEGRR